MPAPTDPLAPHIAKRIRKLREKRGLTQEELGTLCGVTGRAVRSWENNEKLPRTETLPCLALHLEVEVWELFHPTGKRRNGNGR